MYIAYNYTEMKATSEQLNTILNEGISPESIRRFIDCGLALNWTGLAAERFRDDLHKLERISEYNACELRSIANYPKMCAEKMAEADNKIAAKIRALFSK